VHWIFQDQAQAMARRLDFILFQPLVEVALVCEGLQAALRRTNAGSDKDGKGSKNVLGSMAKCLV
jgi:hypothetical protein